VRHLGVFFIAAACLWSIGCETQTTNPITGGTSNPTLPAFQDSSVFMETVDLSVNKEVFHAVDVLGTILFDIVPAVDSPANKGATRKPFSVFVHTEMTFRRSQDYTMFQDWKAGGKSSDRMMLEEGVVAMLFKSYQIWSISNEAYINIIYGITPSSVNVRVLWVSYEPVPLESFLQAR